MKLQDAVRRFRHVETEMENEKKFACELWRVFTRERKCGKFVWPNLQVVVQGFRKVSKASRDLKIWNVPWKLRTVLSFLEFSLNPGYVFELNEKKNF